MQKRGNSGHKSCDRHVPGASAVWQSAGAGVPQDCRWEQRSFSRFHCGYQERYTVLQDYNDTDILPALTVSYPAL